MRKRSLRRNTLAKSPQERRVAACFRRLVQMRIFARPAGLQF